MKMRDSEAALSSVERQLKEAEARVQSLQHELSDAKESAEAAKVEAAKAISAQETLHEDLEASQRRLKEMEAEREKRIIEVQNEAVREEKRKREQTENQLKRAHSALAQVKSDVDRLRRDQVKQVRQKEEDSSRWGDGRRSSGTYEETIIRLKKQVEELHLRLEEAESSRGGVLYEPSRLQASEGEESADDKLLKMKETVHNLEAQCKQLKAANEVLRATAAEAEGRVHEVQGRLLSMEQSGRMKSTVSSRSEEIVAEMKNELDKLRQEKNLRDSRMSSLEAKMRHEKHETERKWKEELQKEKYTSEKLRSENQTLREKMAKALGDIWRREKKAADTEDKLRGKSREVASTLSRLEGLRQSPSPSIPLSGLSYQAKSLSSYGRQDPQKALPPSSDAKIINEFLNE
mmetsp:Transcript_48633/g.126175  ORF Transcript_48633/g.126175 Transcript_48633/m.126175 type:complete len:405 (-) Transcript_48633:1189-2403(-)